jgi:hypothetical protein
MATVDLGELRGVLATAATTPGSRQRTSSGEFEGGRDTMAPMLQIALAARPSSRVGEDARGRRHRYRARGRSQALDVLAGGVDQSARRRVWRTAVRAVLREADVDAAV